MVENKPIIFWGWNGELDLDVLLCQLDDIKASGVGFVMPHARIGLQTEYFGEKWWDIYDKVVQRCQKIGLKVWIYDEKGWPSGFGGGAMLENNTFPMQYLIFSTTNKFDSSAFIVYIKSSDGYNRVFEECDASEYFCIYLKSVNTYVDVLNPKVTDKFIEHTYNEYYKRYKAYFGKTIVGYFTDEPQYYRTGTPYTTMLESEFYSKYNYDYKNKLIYLFVDCDGAEEFRYDYYLLLNELYTNNYVKRLYEFCDSKGAKLSGHSVEEMNFSGQMSCCAGVMPFYEYEHIPAIDWLGNVCFFDISAKQCVSVAEQLGKESTMVELFAVSGLSPTPKRLKQLYDFLAVDGISLNCESIYECSAKGEGKRDYPVDFSPVLAWEKEAKFLNRHFEFVAEFNKKKEKADTLILHPIRSAYLNFRRDEVYRADELLEDFICVAKLCNSRGLAYHFGDEGIIARHGRVEKDKLIVGNIEYNKIIIPSMYTVSSCVLKLLQAFVSGGGKVYYSGILPSRVDGKKCDVKINNLQKLSQIGYGKYYLKGINSDVSNVKMSYRSQGSQDYIFMVNLKQEKVNLEIVGAKGGSELDTINNNSISINVKNILLEPMESKIIALSSKQTDIQAIEYKERTLSNNWNVSAHNMAIFDKAHYIIKGESGDAFINDMRQKLFDIRYSGALELIYDIECLYLPKDLQIIVEDNAKVYFNDVELKDYSKWRDNNFRAYQVSALVKLGVNKARFVYEYYQNNELYNILQSPESFESVKNAVYYDTNIENLMLCGDFCISGENKNFSGDFYKMSGGYKLAKQSDTIDIKNISLAGYQFFSGRMLLTSGFYSSSENAILKIIGNVPAINVKINNVNCGTIIFGQELIIHNLKNGFNTICLELVSGNRNIFGAFHMGSEPDYVAPFHYKITSDSPEFSEDYLLLNMRIENIILKEIIA